jgi:GR25 family glycosyltransferase involved in LPS biosynthesis
MNATYSKASMYDDGGGIKSKKSLKKLPVYVVNMDKRMDRWDYVYAHLKQHGFNNIKRLPAVDGRMIDSNQLKVLLGKGLFEKLGKYRATDETVGSLGAVGCYMSHYKVWSKILESGKPALVVEDDMVLDADIDSFYIVDDCSKLEEYDTVLLGYLALRTKTKRPQSDGLYPYKGMFWGTHFYYITPRGAEKLLSRGLPIKHQVDAYISFQSKKDVVKLGYHYPNLSVQDNRFGTDIQTPLENGDRPNNATEVLRICAVVVGLMALISVLVLVIMYMSDRK